MRSKAGYIRNVTWEQKSCYQEWKKYPQAIFPSEGVTREVPLTVRIKIKVDSSLIAIPPKSLILKEKNFQN